MPIKAFTHFTYVVCTTANNTGKVRPQWLQHSRHAVCNSGRGKNGQLAIAGQKGTTKLLYTTGKVRPQWLYTTLSNTDHFSKFFHYQTMQKIVMEFFINNPNPT